MTATNEKQNLIERQEATDTLAELIREIPVAMLTTIQDDGVLSSRPMVNVNRKFVGDLWFISPSQDPKVIEIAKHGQVNVCFAEPSRHQYVSVAGRASVEKDRKRTELLWTDECDTWFPQDVDKSDLSLIKVDVTSAEYWDASKSSMVALGSLVRRVMTGDPTRAVDHEKVDWK